MLTRIRNAVAVGHEKVDDADSPTSERGLRGSSASRVSSTASRPRREAVKLEPDRRSSLWPQANPGYCRSACGSRDPGTASTGIVGNHAACKVAWGSQSFPPPRAFWPTARPVAAASGARSCARFGDMSRIGKKPIPVPAGVDVKIDGGAGRRSKAHAGRLERTFPTSVSRSRHEEGQLTRCAPRR